MLIYYSDHFVLPLPAGHRFPMEKYSLLRARVEGTPWGSGVALRVPDPATDQELATVHSTRYIRRVVEGELAPSDIRRIGFPWSQHLVERSRRSVGATLGAARGALADGVGVSLSGGTHHAFPDRGEGFCVFNDVAVAARVMQREGRARHVAILDLDVHQGNGTAAIFRGDPSVFTLSVHGGNNFPFRKEVSDLDLELADAAGDEVFLDAAHRGVAEALARSSPDLAIYVAGADPYLGDRLGRLGMTKEGLEERDRLVFEQCRRAGVPVAVVMGGGYAARVEDAVDIHFNTVRAAVEAFSTGVGPVRRLGIEDRSP